MDLYLNDYFNWQPIYHGMPRYIEIMPILPSRSGNFLFLSFYIVFLCIGQLRGMSKSKDGAMLFAQTHLYPFILI